MTDRLRNAARLLAAGLATVASLCDDAAWWLTSRTDPCSSCGRAAPRDADGLCLPCAEAAADEILTNAFGERGQA